MTSGVALIICPPTEAVNRKLLGLTVGERLLLTLEKGGIGTVAFAGDGPKPESKRSGRTPSSRRRESRIP